MATQTQFTTPEPVESYKFEPIQGYPMLHWKGKRPFESTQYYPAQLKETYGNETNGWRNKIYWGDNLQVMSHLLKEYRGKISLIYIDPPFDSKADYKRRIELRGRRVENDRSAFEEKQYSDIWTNDEYLQFMYERLILLRELLAENGCIYVHCDWKVNSLIRLILDEVFGTQQFVNQIVWHYYNKMAPDSKCFPRASDDILAFAKVQGAHIFNKQTEKREAPVKQLVRKFVNGRAINVRDDDGNVLYRMSDERRVDDVWRIPMLQPADKTENLRYPTQKPEPLLARIIKASSNPGDLVLDCFMGSGTTQAVAMKLGRRFIGADINLGAVEITMKRLLDNAKVMEENNEQVEFDAIKECKKEDTPILYTGLEFYNVNHYDIFRNPTQARDLLIEAFEIEPLQTNTIYDGQKDGRMVKIMPINRIATRADLDELIEGFDYRAFKKRSEQHPSLPVEELLLVCMGHEPDLCATLKQQVPYNLDVKVVDVLRDQSSLEFKRESEARIRCRAGNLIVEQFYPMNLLQKLSLTEDIIEDWRFLVDSIKIDFNYDGAVLNPSVCDIPDEDSLVEGVYPIPDDAGTIRIKITDLLSESLEETVE